MIPDILARKESPETTLQACLKTISEKNADINALIDVPSKDVTKTMESLKGKEKGKLYGIPVAVKDNLCVRGWDVTCASNILKGFTAPYNATVIDKILNEGAVLIGRANMDEFAFGSSCETSVYGPTKNPVDPKRVPGGSSGGSAAAVASGMAPLALGSDTGGSIRQPASLCGVVGLKPTYGRVSRYGLIAFASSLDQIGPFATNVEDAAILLGVIAGYDPKDSTSADLPVPDYTQSLNKSIKGMKIGKPKEYFEHDLPADVKKAMDKAVKVLEGEGAEIIDVSLPTTDYAVSIYYIVGPCEASSNLARFDGVKYGNRDQTADTLLSLYTGTREKGFGAEAKRRILLGTYALSSGYYDAYYLKAMKARRKMIDDFNEVFKTVDCLITPTAPGGAFKLGEKMNDPLSMYLSDIFTISANLTGVPGISVPGGFTDDKLPIGVQFMTKAFDEATMLQVASAFEHNRTPSAGEGLGE